MTILVSSCGALYIPNNASQLDEVTCGPYNRGGLLCGEYKDGYGPAVYSFDMTCANCSSLWSQARSQGGFLVARKPLFCQLVIGA